VPLELTGIRQQRAFGWSSEHHGGYFEAESWPTASVFHFCFELSKLVADAIRRDVFEYVDVAYEDPAVEAPGGPRLAKLLDSDVEYDRGVAPFKALFDANFLQPLVEQRDAVRDGRAFRKETKISAIMYGPPGTSKTMLAGMIADALGWPLLPLDPSHLTRRGMDNVHAETDALFGRLRFCDQIVVLLDEFDELVREREAAGELTSRFLTTAMLPKIAALHARRRIVYLVATNRLEQFDAAISRHGRFDVIVPVMPPTAKAKFASNEFAPLVRARELLVSAGEDVAGFDLLVGDLTFAEAKDLAEKLVPVTEVDQLAELIKRASAGATLYQSGADPPAPDIDSLVELVDRARRSAPASQSGVDAPSVSPSGAGGDAVGAEPLAKDTATVAYPKGSWKERMVGQQGKIRGLNL
jgi:hypothetical protein